MTCTFRQACPIAPLAHLVTKPVRREWLAKLCHKIGVGADDWRRLDDRLGLRGQRHVDTLASGAARFRSKTDLK